ncbi:MAG: hypothetical protein R2744_03915 [Bacteroidales bacterium]
MITILHMTPQVKSSGGLAEITGAVCDITENPPTIDPAGIYRSRSKDPGEPRNKDEGVTLGIMPDFAGNVKED